MFDVTDVMTDVNAVVTDTVQQTTGNLSGGRRWGGSASGRARGGRVGSMRLAGELSILLGAGARQHRATQGFPCRGWWREALAGSGVRMQGDALRAACCRWHDPGLLSPR